MAEINKLSVGSALDKLRGTEAPQSQMTRLDGKIEELDEELIRLKATRRRVERDQRAGSTPTNENPADTIPSRRMATAWIIAGMVIVIVISIWAWRGAL